MHTYIHASIWPSIRWHDAHTYTHLSIHIIQKCIRTSSLLTSIHPSSHLSIPASIHPVIHPCIYPSIHPPIHACIRIQMLILVSRTRGPHIFHKTILQPDVLADLHPLIRDLHPFIHPLIHAHLGCGPKAVNCSLAPADKVVEPDNLTTLHYPNQFYFTIPTRKNLHHH